MTAEEGGRKKPCVANMQLMCFSKTWDCAAYVNLVGKDMAMPGEDATMDMKLLKPMVLEEGQQFTVRDSAGTIGTGQLSLLYHNTSRPVFWIKSAWFQKHSEWSRSGYTFGRRIRFLNDKFLP
jgi:hypothetical protein